MNAGESTQFGMVAEASPLVENLAALWAVDPGLARALERLPESAVYPTTLAKSGEPTLSLPTPDGRRIFMHSRHRPMEEARLQVEDAQADERAIFVVHGMGLGYLLEAIFEAAGDEALILVFEPDLALMRTALGARDLSKILLSRRVLFFPTLDKSALFQRLTPHTAMLAAGLGIINHAASLQAQPDFHRQMSEWLNQFVSFSRTNLNTLVLNGRRTCENIARNLAWYAAAPGISRLAGRYAGQPAIIVSAGPSLRKNMHLLKEASERAVLVAVQTTLQPLVDMGIEPDFATSLDYHDICARFFERLPANLKTELVAEPKASGAVFALCPGPVSLTGNEIADRLLREAKLDRPRLQSGATVAHLAFYLAQHLGCDPIIFVGQDLGFSDGLCYAPGTSYEDVWRPETGRFCTAEMKQWEQITRERHILRRIDDHEGRPMYTEERLFTYLQQFERDFAKAGARIIDATEGGARKRGAETMTLREALDACCTRPVPRVGPPHAGYDWEAAAQCAKSLSARAEEAMEIARIGEEMLPLLDEVRAHLEDQSRVNVAIGRIDALRARMNGLGTTYDLIMQMTQRSELERFQRDRRIAASKVRGLEKQRRQVERDIENVRNVNAAAMEFQKLMADAASVAAALRISRCAERAA